MSDGNKKSSRKEPDAKKKKYEKPTLKSENLTAVAALCNGLNTGGRKALVASGCQSTRLLS